jgi:hypothetical protein
VAYSCNPRTEESKAEGWRIQASLEYIAEPVSKKVTDNAISLPKTRVSIHISLFAGGCYIEKKEVINILYQ